MLTVGSEAGTRNYAKRIYADFLNGFRDKKMAFPEIFDDYEKYHEVVNTGRLLRAYLIEDWIDRDSSVLDVGIGDGSLVTVSIRLLISNFRSFTTLFGIVTMI